MRLEVPLVLLAALSRHTLVGARSIDDDLWHSHVGMFLIDQRNNQRGIEQFTSVIIYLSMCTGLSHTLVDKVIFFGARCQICTPITCNDS